MDKDIPYDMDKCVHQLVGGGRTKATKADSVKEQITSHMESVGWSREFLNRFFENFKNPMSYGRHINLFIEDLMKAYLIKLHVMPYTPLSDVYTAIGIKHDVAFHVADICEPLVGDSSYTYDQIIDIGIDYVINKYATLGSNTTTHPFHENELRSWYNISECKGTTFPRPYVCLNVPFRIAQLKKQHKTIESLLRHIPSHNPDTHDLHYHATSWSASVSIMTELSHHVGRPCLDFGIKSGFYISQTLQDAMNFGWKRQGVFRNEVAILVFSLPKNISTYPTISYKELTGEQWTYITKKARMCEQRILELPEIANFDMVFGDMVANPDDVKYRGIDPVRHTPPKTQLVSKRAHGDMFLQHHLRGCIYFQKFVPTNTRKNKTKSSNILSLV